MLEDWVGGGARCEYMAANVFKCSFGGIVLQYGGRCWSTQCSQQAAGFARKLIVVTGWARVAFNVSSSKQQEP